MESKQRPIRSKSLNQTVRSSIRRKVSFTKVRQQFENMAKGQDKSGLNAIRSLSSQSKTVTVSDKTLQSIEEIHPNSDHRLSDVSFNSQDISSFETLSDGSIDPNNDRRLSNSSLVKNKIIFFEEKSYHKKITEKVYCDANDLVVKQTDDCDDKTSSHGNYHMEQFNKSDQTISDMPSIESNYSELDSEPNDSQDIDNNEEQNSVPEKQCPDLERTKPFLVRTSSTASDTSVNSDILSLDEKSDIVFRRPHTSEPIVKPIPRQRISLKKIYEMENIASINQLFSEIDAKQESIITDLKRGSGISQDSGVSDLFQNQTSFLHTQTNKNNHDKLPSKTNIIPDIQIKDDDDQIYQDNGIYDEDIYEHIYEELSNCVTLSPSEWIDIENDDNQVLKAEAIINRRSHISKHNNYRKSYRPIPSKRRFPKKELPIVRICPSDHSDSATEYEDIDDSDDMITSSCNTDSETKQRHLLVVDRLMTEQRVSHHIYEMLPDMHPIQEDKEIDIKRQLVRELSNKLVVKGCEDETTVRPQSRSTEPNIYTETPIRRKLISNLQNSDKYSKRDSIMSRNSSIYISPNYGDTYLDRRNCPSSLSSAHGLLSRQFFTQESVTASIASYLELNISADNMSSPFKSEPLYQFYQKDVRRRAELWIHNNNDLDYNEYENSIYGTTGSGKVTEVKKDDTIKNMLAKSNISAMDFVGTGPNRSLWCQLPQVIDSKDNLLTTLSDKEKRLQESMFEIITSEASYCKSLNILVSHFNNCIEFSENNPQILSQREKKCLFSNVIDISRISSNLLTELEKRFDQNILLYDVCDILYDYCVNHFQPYIHYCAYQRDQEKLLTKLTQSRSCFVEVLQRLESNQICQNQNLLSFLMLPMQRITRYPLLIDAVCQQLPSDSPILESTNKALGAANQLVRKCNEETTKVQRMQELIEIEKNLHFKSKMKSYPIVSGARYLVKKGSVLRLTPQLSAKKTIGKSTTLKWTKLQIHLFLFSDLLILAKKKSENNFCVFDYCSRNTVQMVSLNESGDPNGLTGKLRITVSRNYPHLAQLILLHNHESKSMEYTIAFSLESEKLRWIEAVSQPLSQNPNEVIYEEWDCPQVQCIKAYSAQQTDEINLEETDVLNVFRKMNDGWFEGQRIRDGQKGWFPSEFTEEIVNQHVRARNMKLRHRLLMYTQSVINEQNKSTLDLQK